MTDDFERRVRAWMAETGDAPATQVSRVAASVSTLPGRRRPALSGFALAAVLLLIVALGAMVVRPSGGQLGAAPGSQAAGSTSPTATAGPTPPDPAAFAGDPRLQRCGGVGVVGIESVFEMRHAYDYHRHLPQMGISPELDDSSLPALVVVYRGDPLIPIAGAAPPPGTTWPPVSLTPGHRDVCIVVGTEELNQYADVDIGGMVVSLPGDVLSSRSPDGTPSAEATAVNVAPSPSPAPAITEEPTDPGATGLPTAVPGSLEAGARERVTAGSSGCVWQALELRREMPAAELDALIELAGGTDRFVSTDSLFAGDINVAVGAMDGEDLIGGDGNEAWIVVPDRNGDPSAIKFVRLHATSIDVWARSGSLYRCGAEPTPGPPAGHGRLDPVCLPAGVECSEGSRTVVPGIYLRNHYGPGVFVWTGGSPDLLRSFISLRGSGRLMTMDRVWDAGGSVGIVVRTGACPGTTLGTLPIHDYSKGADQVLVIDVSTDGTVSGRGVKDLGAGPVGDGQLPEYRACSPG